MNFLWLAITAALISSGLTLLRNASLQRYILDEPMVEAMEFADFPVKPHPVYPRRWLLVLSFAIIAVSTILAIFEITTPAIILLVIGMFAFFIYDIPGASRMANLIVLPDLIYLETISEPKRVFKIPKNDIKKTVLTSSGFYIELSSLKIGNRLPFKSKHADEIIIKIEEIL